MAKQLSAFANTGGGQIIYGVEDDGTIGLGGVSVNIKPGGTKDWLENKIPKLTEYEIVGFGVHEFVPKSSSSRIANGKALYVIDVPDSDRAPHQSVRDKKYYVRNDSHSEPARHKIIEDIRNRQKHPSVWLWDATTGDTQAKQVDPNLYALDTVLRIVLANEGSLKSTDTFLLLNPQRGSFNFVLDQGIATEVTGTRPGNYQWQLKRPLPPQSETTFRAQYHVLARFNAETSRWLDDAGKTLFEDIAIEWTIFADSAPPETDKITLGNLGLMMFLHKFSK